MSDAAWGTGFDPDRLARLELRAWKAYYRRRAGQAFGLLVLANHEQAHASWPRAVLAAFFLARGAYGFARADGNYDRFARTSRAATARWECPRTLTRRKSPAANCAGGWCAARSA